MTGFESFVLTSIQVATVAAIGVSIWSQTFRTWVNQLAMRTFVVLDRGLEVSLISPIFAMMMIDSIDHSIPGMTILSVALYALIAVIVTKSALVVIYGIRQERGLHAAWLVFYSYFLWTIQADVFGIHSNEPSESKVVFMVINVLTPLVLFMWAIIVRTKSTE